MIVCFGCGCVLAGGGEGLMPKVSRLGTLVPGLATGPGDFLLSPLRNITGGSLLAVARKT